MPEGPSIVILRELLQPYEKQTVVQAEGNAKIDMHRLNGKKIVAFKSWGKHTLICFDDFFIRIHLLMFGTYRINERKDTTPRLRLMLKKAEINFYTCSVQLWEGSPDDVYDWERDTMSDLWKPLKAEKSLKEMGDTEACDALLDQDVFAGVGNIIKNEVLFRIRVHPESLIGALTPRKKKELVKEARAYCFDFYTWKKEFTLKQHWLAHRKKECPRCKVPLILKVTGKNKRRSFYCEQCQERYT
jgi:endonuclease-8